MMSLVFGNDISDSGFDKDGALMRDRFPPKDLMLIGLNISTSGRGVVTTDEIVAVSFFCAVAPPNLTRALFLLLRVPLS